MTIPCMKRAIAVSFALLALAGCGRDAPETGSKDTEAIEVAEEAMSAIADLEAESDELASALDDLKADRKGLSKRLANVAGRLRSSIGDLRAALADAEGEATSASGSAGAAVDKAESALRELSILENRFDYHLRNGHGGG